MPAQPTLYSSDWETGRDGLKPGSSLQKAKYMICVTEFGIDGSGQAQVKSHATSKGHVSKVANPKSQRVLKFSTTGELSGHTASGGGMSVAKQALRAEISNTLHTAEYNHSLSSTSADGERFRQMFPGILRLRIISAPHPRPSNSFVLAYLIS